MDGYVRIGAELDTEEFDKELQKLYDKLELNQNKIARLTRRKEKLDINADSYNRKLDEAQRKADELYDKMRSIAKEQLIKKQMPTDQDNVEAMMQNFSTKNLNFNDMGIGIEYAKFKELEAEQEKYLNRAKIAEENAKIVAQDQKIVADQIARASAEQTTLNEKITEATENMHSEAYASSEAFDSIKSQVVGVGEGIALNVGTALSKVNSQLKKMSSGLTNTVKKVARWGLAIFGIRTAYNAVRTAVSAITSENETLKNQIEAIKTGVSNLLEPAITRIVSLIATLMSFIGSLIKSLTGKDIFAGGSKNLASGAKSAEEINKQLAGFDEMTVLSDNKSSGGGGGSGDAVSSDLGQVNEKLLGTLNKIKELIMNGDWDLLAKMFSDALIKGIDWVIEKLKSIPWEEIGQAFSDFITNIDYSGVLVGLVDAVWQAFSGVLDLLLTIDWGKFFNLLTTGITDALQRSADYIAQIDWGRIGKTISDIFTNIDWAGMGNAMFEQIWNTLTGLLDTLVSIDWGEVGRTVFESISSWLQKLGELVRNTDWAQLGKDIITAIIDFIKNINWAQLILDLFNLLVDLIVGSIDLIIGAVEGLIDGIIAMFEDPEFLNKMFEAGLDLVEGLLKGLWTIITKVAELIWKLIQKILELFGIHSPSKVFEDIGTQLMEGLINGIKNLINTIVDIFKKLIEGIKTIFNAFKDFISKLLETIKNIVLTVIKWHQQAIEAGINFIKGIIQAVVNWFKGQIDLAVAVVTYIIDYVKSLIGNIVNWIVEKFNAVVNFFKGIGIAIGDFFSSAIKTAVNGALSWIESKVNWFIDKINGVIGWVNKLPIGVSIGKLSRISLPRLAVGGIINQPSRGVPVGGAIAGESGREGILPLTDQRAMAELGKEIGKWININATIPVNIGNRQVARILEEITADREFAMNS